jgi:diguanylate cyclase (GGDEF)-like protein
MHISRKRAGRNPLHSFKWLDDAVAKLHGFHGSESDFMQCVTSLAEQLPVVRKAAIWSHGDGSGEHVELVTASPGSAEDAAPQPPSMLLRATQPDRLDLTFANVGRWNKLVLSLSPWPGMDFKTTDRRVLADFAQHASLALGRLSAVDAARRRTNSLTLLNRLSVTMASTLDLETLFDTMYSEIRKVMLTDAFFVARYYPAQNEVDIAYLYEAGQRLDPIRYALNEGPTSVAIRTGQPLLFNMDHRQIPGARTAGPQGRSTQSLMIVPISLHGKVLGALSVQTYEANAYDAELLQLLFTIASQAAIALENANLYEETLRQATTDHMTGLLNRQAFLGALDKALEGAHFSGSPLALVMFDSDSLKAINDEHGHHAGDEHIHSMAEIIRAGVREEDKTCRYGGDEFLLILPGADRAMAHEVAQRILERICGHTLPLEGTSVRVTASAGVAVYPADALTRDALLAAADRATYAAKQAGKACVR